MYMFKYILKRIGLMLMTFAIIITICFVLVKLLPITIDVAIGGDAKLMYEFLDSRGYFDPIPVQFFKYLKRIFLYGDFGIGTYMYKKQSVVDVLFSKLPPTVIINVFSSLFSVPLGIGLGIFAALKKNKWQDHFIRFIWNHNASRYRLL